MIARSHGIVVPNWTDESRLSQTRNMGTPWTAINPGFDDWWKIPWRDSRNLWAWMLPIALAKSVRPILEVHTCEVRSPPGPQYESPTSQNNSADNRYQNTDNRSYSFIFPHSVSNLLSLTIWVIARWRSRFGHLTDQRKLLSGLQGIGSAVHTGCWFV